MPDTVTLLPARTLLAQLDGLKTLGLDMRAIQSAVGPVPAAPDTLIPASRYLAMWSAAQLQYAQPGLGTALAMTIPFGAFGPLDYLAGSADSVGGCCRSAVAYFSMLASDVWLELHSHAQGTHAIHVRSAPGMPDEIPEFTLAVLMNRLRHVTDNAFVTARLLLPVARPLADPVREKWWRTQIEYDSAHAALCIDGDNWMRPVPRADARLHAALREMATQLQLSKQGESTLETALRARLRIALGQGKVQPRAMAGLLGVSERTLQRRLAEIGRSYSDIIEEFRREESQRLLRDTDAQLIDIAAQLGYAEHTSFTRAFRRWNRLTPSQWRETARTRQQ